MDRELQLRLQHLKEDFQSVSGQTWKHFFCPILHSDEKAEISRGHVINKALPNSDRSWVPQRADVDNFFGSHFEADFLAIDKKIGRSPFTIFIDKDLRRLFNPKLLLNGEEVDNYLPQPSNVIPDEHLEVTIIDDGQSAPVVLKPTPSQRLAVHDGRFQIDVSKDVPIQAFVSLLKAAHLTLFHLMGYNYALSPGGCFLGRQLLGELLLKTRKLNPTETVEIAVEHYRPFHNMVRVSIPSTTSFKGTVTDRLANAIMDGNRVWALQVFVRAGHDIGLVMIPTLDHPDSITEFRQFLSAEGSTLECRSIRLNCTQIEMSERSFEMIWPAWEL